MPSGRSRHSCRIGESKRQSQRSGENLMTFREARREFETLFLTRSLIEHGWHISNTARTLGVSRKTLHVKIRALGIQCSLCGRVGASNQFGNGRPAAGKI
jgi:DNA-binding NtrC family response regulator